MALEEDAAFVNSAAEGEAQITRVRVASGRTYEIDGSLAAGDRRYTDRTYAFEGKIPAELAGQPFIRTAYADGKSDGADADFLSFDVDRNVVVYVAYYDKAILPDWLKGWSDSGLALRDDRHGAASSLYRKNFPRGTVRLPGSPSGVMYNVFVVADGSAAVEVTAPTDSSGPLRISGVQVASKQAYVVDARLAAGDRRYIDEPFAVTAPLPAELAGQQFIRTAYADGKKGIADPDFLKFTVDREVTVYVSYYDKAILPDWLKSWSRTEWAIRDDKHAAPSTFYARKFAAGTVQLPGSPSGVMYTVVVVPTGSAPGEDDTADVPPQAPSGLKVTGQTSSTIDLAWDSVSESAGYRILRDGVVVDSAVSTTYTDAGLAPATQYAYQVLAYGASGSTSPRSAVVTGTTSAAQQIAVPQRLAAFPGAEGFGANALSACRSLPLQVLSVTNTGDSGPGSFRAALAAARPDRFTIIKFDVAGYIHVIGRVIAETRDLSCVYVAGQTAPGGGVNIGAPTMDFDGILLEGNDSRDQVWRHLRFRLGSNDGSKGISMQEIRNAVFDHLSISWGGEKAMVISPTLPDSTVDITVSRSIFAETSALHPTAFQVTGQNRDRPSNARVALLRNFFTGNSYRNPVVAAWKTLMLNNLIYNWNFAATKGPGNAAISEADIVNNYYRPGPMTNGRFQHGVVIECTRGNNPDPAYPDISIHVSGNIDPHNSDPYATHAAQTTGPNRVTACYYRTGGSGGEAVPASYKAWRSARLPLPAFAPVELLATQVPADVLGDVGANAGITCSGDWYRRTDAVDARLISEYRNGTGVSRPPLSANDVGGFPRVATGRACADSDGDGLPNAWETRYPAAADPAADPDRDGYLNIEEYINGTNPTSAG